MLPENTNHEQTERLGKDILGPHLKDAGTIRIRRRQQGREVEVMREDRAVVTHAPIA